MIVLGYIKIFLKGCYAKLSQRVEDFINFILSNLKNIIECEIRCPCVKYKNKKFHHKDVVMMHLLKKEFVDKYFCWVPHVPYTIMFERMVDLTSSSSNIHEFAYDNSNPYRSLVMDAMRMNQNYSCEGSRNIPLDEELNVDTTMFFELLKDFNEPLWDGCINYSKLLVIAQLFTIKWNYRLDKVDYDRILEWAKSM